MKLEQQMEIKWKAGLLCGLPGRVHSCRKPFVTALGRAGCLPAAEDVPWGTRGQSHLVCQPGSEQGTGEFVTLSTSVCQSCRGSSGRAQHSQEFAHGTLA